MRAFILFSILVVLMGARPGSAGAGAIEMITGKVESQVTGQVQGQINAVQKQATSEIGKQVQSVTGTVTQTVGNTVRDAANATGVTDTVKQWALPGGDTLKLLGKSGEGVASYVDQAGKVMKLTAQESIDMGVPESDVKDTFNLSDNASTGTGDVILGGAGADTPQFGGPSPLLSDETLDRIGSDGNTDTAQATPPADPFAGGDGCHSTGSGDYVCADAD